MSSMNNLLYITMNSKDFRITLNANCGYYVVKKMWIQGY